MGHQNYDLQKKILDFIDKTFYSLKDNIKRMKRQVTEEKIFVYHIFDSELIYKYNI